MRIPTDYTKPERGTFEVINKTNDGIIEATGWTSELSQFGLKIGMVKDGREWVNYELSSGARIGKNNYSETLTTRKSAIVDAWEKLLKNKENIEVAISQAKVKFESLKEAS